jgi:diguanylate cyclase (GGDEF)-like protein
MDFSKEKSGQVSLIFVDIDHFKYYNDLYGHERGNKALIKLASILKKNIRSKDIVCRYGGEEFVIILPCTSKKRALSVAENLRYLVENTYFEGEENQINGKMTISMGLSNYPDDANDEYELIKTCEDALYRAKYLSRNRVESYTSILDELKNEIEEDQFENVASIKTLIGVINAKDKYTFGHVERVVMYGKIFANKLGLDKKDTKALVYAAYMHDIGKINISVDILNKKEPLTNEEWEQLKLHPTQGVDIIKNIPPLNNILPYILHHHERYDGRGYPYGLKGNDIPYLARVLTVVDSFDAMTSKRPYGESKTYDKAIDELERCMGTQFDPYLASEFIEVVKKYKSRFDDLESVINEMNN